MSRGSQKTCAKLLGEFAREIRQFMALGSSFFRAAAERLGLAVTDMQVIDLLESEGEATAGQLADLVGLTTGAITGMLNRLEEAGLVRRERDPNDGRRVIVRLARDKDEMHKIGPIFDSLGKAWDELASDYDDEQIAFLLSFLKRSNAMTRKEIIRLQEAPSSEGGIFSAPLLDLKRGRLVVSSGVSRLTLRTTEGMAELYQARFAGAAPRVRGRRVRWVDRCDHLVAAGVVRADLPGQPPAGVGLHAARRRHARRRRHIAALYGPPGQPVDRVVLRGRRDGRGDSGALERRDFLLDRCVPHARRRDSG